MLFEWRIIFVDWDLHLVLSCIISMTNRNKIKLKLGLKPLKNKINKCKKIQVILWWLFCDVVEQVRVRSRSPNLYERTNNHLTGLEKKSISFQRVTLMAIWKRYIVMIRRMRLKRIRNCSMPLSSAGVPVKISNMTIKLFLLAGYFWSWRQRIDSIVCKDHRITVD